MVNDVLNRAGTAIPAFALASDGNRTLRGLYFRPEGAEGDAEGAADGGNADVENANEDSGSGDDADAESTIDKRTYDAVLRDLTKERAARKKFKKQLEEFTKSQPSPEELKAFREYLANKEKAQADEDKRQKNYEKIIAENANKHKTEVSEWEAKYNALQNQRNEERIDAMLAMHIPKHTTIAVEDVIPLIRPAFRYDEDGDLVVELKGEPVLDDKGHPMTPEAFIEREISRRPFLANAAPKGGSGSQNGKGKGGGKTRTLTDEQIANMTHDEFLAWERDNQTELRRKPTRV